MRFQQAVLKSGVLLAAGLFLTACNPATKGWSSANGGSVSFARLVAAKSDCNYSRARKRAIRLLRASGNREHNEQRAARIMDRAERCMRRYGVNYTRGAYSIGQRKGKR